MQQVAQKQAIKSWQRVRLDAIYTPDYQRPLSKKADAIAQSFNSVAVGAIILSLREDGKIFVIDGLQRLQAMRKIGITDTDAIVWEGLSITDESIAFEFCNSRRAHLAAKDRFKSRIMRSDYSAIAIKNSVHNNGYFLAGLSNVGSVQAINCFEALDEVFKRLGAARFELMWQLMHNIWPTCPGASLTAVFVKAFADVMQILEKDQAAGIRKLHKKEPRELLTQATHVAHSITKSPRIVLRTILQEALG